MKKLIKVWANKNIYSHQINGSKDTIKRGEIQDKDYIGMSKDSSVCYDIGVIKDIEYDYNEIPLTYNLPLQIK